MRRNAEAATQVRHASSFVLPVLLVLSLIWPEVSAALLPLAVTTDVLAVVDSTVWMACVQVRREPLLRGLWAEPQAVLLPVGGTVMHSVWVVVCLLRGDFVKTPVYVSALASVLVAIPYLALAMALRPYAYALTPAEFVGVAFLGALVSLAVLYAVV